MQLRRREFHQHCKSRTDNGYNALATRDHSGETAVAEKFEALVKLGLLYSRMKDFYDIWLLSRQFDFDGRILAEAIEF
jgi:hypothetical protein